MSANLRCPQCLLSSCVDCEEEGCPGLGGFVALEEVRPDVKMMGTLGREIRELEDLVVLAGNLLAGEETNAEAGRVRVMNAALMIAGKRERSRKGTQKI